MYICPTETNIVLIILVSVMCGIVVGAILTMKVEK